MKIFNLKDYPGDYSMHCKTKKEDAEFSKLLDSLGKKWCSGASYLCENRWDTYKKKYCHFFNEGMYGDTDFAKEHEYKILEWSDFSQDYNTLYKDVLKEMRQ